MWRKEKFQNLIKKELGKTILREIDIHPGVLLTLTRVEITPDFSQAKIYFSVIPKEREKETFEKINKNIYFLQQKLNKRLKIEVPKIVFKKETKTEEAAKVEGILEKLKKDGN